MGSVHIAEKCLKITKVKKILMILSRMTKCVQMQNTKDHFGRKPGLLSGCVFDAIYRGFSFMDGKKNL